MGLNTLFTLLLPPITGTVIGYFTNWLAIKMLFRPYTKKTVQIPQLNINFDIPFTPGLFPKEQARLATKVAETITHQLLTPDDIKNITVKLITPKNIEISVDKIVDAILKEFQNIRKLRDISEEIAQLIAAFLKQSAPGIIEDAVNRSTLARELLEKGFDTVILNLHIPKQTSLAITSSLFDNIATPNVLRNWMLGLLTDENVIMIDKLVKENAKGGYFIISRIITVRTLLDALKDFLKNDPESANEVIQETIEKLHLKEKLAYSLSNMNFQKLPYSTVAMLKEYFVSILITYIMENSKQMAEKFSTDDMTKILTERILRFDTSKVNPETLTTIKREVASFISKYLERELGQLMEQAIPALGIDSVISAKVIKFSPQRLERLIIDISHRELAGIEILGGILGFLIGCINTVFLMVSGL